MTYRCQQTAAGRRWFSNRAPKPANRAPHPRNRKAIFRQTRQEIEHRFPRSMLAADDIKTFVGEPQFSGRHTAREHCVTNIACRLVSRDAWLSVLLNTGPNRMERIYSENFRIPKMEATIESQMLHGIGMCVVRNNSTLRKRPRLPCQCRREPCVAFKWQPTDSKQLAISSSESVDALSTTIISSGPYD